MRLRQIEIGKGIHSNVLSFRSGVGSAGHVRSGQARSFARWPGQALKLSHVTGMFGIVASAGTAALGKCASRILVEGRQRWASYGRVALQCQTIPRVRRKNFTWLPRGHRLARGARSAKRIAVAETDTGGGSPDCRNSLSPSARFSENPMHLLPPCRLRFPPSCGTGYLYGHVRLAGPQGSRHQAVDVVDSRIGHGIAAGRQAGAMDTDGPGAAPGPIEGIGKADIEGAVIAQLGSSWRAETKSSPLWRLAITLGELRPETARPGADGHRSARAESGRPSRAYFAIGFHP